MSVAGVQYLSAFVLQSLNRFLFSLSDGLLTTGAINTRITMRKKKLNGLEEDAEEKAPPSSINGRMQQPKQQHASFAHRSASFHFWLVSLAIILLRVSASSSGERQSMGANML